MAGGAATFRTSGYPLGGGQTVSFTRVTTLIPQHTLKSGSSYEKLLFSLKCPPGHPDLSLLPICVSFYPFLCGGVREHRRGRIAICNQRCS